MNYSLFHRTDSIILCLFLFLAMFLLFLTGKSLAHIKKAEEDVAGEMKSLLAALLAMLGLILAFSFGVSGNRYEQTRNILVEEANNIGTAVLRADLYNDSVRKVFRTHFETYVEARIGLYENLGDTLHYHKCSSEMQGAKERLWKLATDQSKLPNMLIPSNQMVPALNSMFDVAASRDVLFKTQVPDLILYMLFILALLSSFLTGLISGKMNVKEWIIVTCFIFFLTLIIYTTLDLSRPFRGLIKANNGQQAILDLKEMFK